MTKSELRTLFKQKRQKMTKNHLEEDSLSIANNLLQLNIWDRQFFHIYLPIQSKNEVDTEPILNILSGKDKNIAIPKSDFKTLEFKNILLTDATTFKTSDYGISEPIDGIEINSNRFDVVFIPLLAFDKNGRRVGYGKGFYDRFLAQCRKDCIKIGLSQFNSVESIDDADEYDIKLDYCITPHIVYDF